MEQQSDLVPSMIIPKKEEESSPFLRESQSFVLPQFEERQNIKDEYDDDDDVGFDLYEVSEAEF